MSVTSSRLRHHGVPGLQAQKWVSTENTSASTDRDRHHLGDRLTEHLDDFQRQIRHGGLIRSEVLKGYPLMLKEP